MIKTIVIVVIMVAVNLLMVFSIKRAAARVDYTLRRLFMQKVSLQVPEEEHKVGAVDKTEQEKPVTIINQVVLPAPDNIKTASFKSSSLRDDYRTIKKISEYTPEYALDCAKNQVGYFHSGPARDYVGLLEKLDFNTVYEMASLDPEQQQQLLRSNLTADQTSVLDDFLAEGVKTFNSVDFYSYVKQMAAIYSSGFTIKTGNIEDDGRVLPDGTRITYDDQICEGSKVIYENKLYDYSL